MTGSQVVRYLCFVSLLISVSSGSWAATIYTFTTIDVPAATFTRAFGINDGGQIVGDFLDARGEHGFLKDGATFTTIDGAFGSTLALGINDVGQIVGSTGSVGFLKDDASFTTINVPGALFTQPSGINDAGQIVGLFGDATSRDHGFLKDGAIFTTLP